MLIAQSLGEYGALTGGGGIADFFDNLEYTIRDAGPTTWFVVVLGGLLVWFFFLRAR